MKKRVSTLNYSLAYNCRKHIFPGSGCTCKYEVPATLRLEGVCKVFADAKDFSCLIAYRFVIAECFPEKAFADTGISGVAFYQA